MSSKNKGRKEHKQGNDKRKKNPPTSRKDKRGKKTSRPPQKGASMSAQARSYVLANVDPTDDGAKGARQAGPYGAPTVTSVNDPKVIMAADVNGNIDAIIINSPYQTMWVQDPTTVLSGTDLTVFAGASNGWYYSETGATLGAKMDTYRKVGNGAVIKSLQPPGTGIGTLLVGILPMCKSIFGPRGLSTVVPTASASYNAITGGALESGNHIPTSLRNVREFKAFTATELIQREIRVHNKNFSGSRGDFLCTNNSTDYNATTSNYEEVLVTSGTANYNASDAVETTTTNGWTCIVIRGYGFPTDGKPHISIDCCSHIEGEPAVSNNAGGAAYVQDGVGTHIGDQMYTDKLTMLINKHPAVSLVDVVEAKPMNISAFRKMSLKGGGKMVARDTLDTITHHVLKYMIGTWASRSDTYTKDESNARFLYLADEASTAYSPADVNGVITGLSYTVRGLYTNTSTAPYLASARVSSNGTFVAAANAAIKIACSPLYNNVTQSGTYLLKIAGTWTVCLWQCDGVFIYFYASVNGLAFTIGVTYDVVTQGLVMPLEAI